MTVDLDLIHNGRRSTAEVTTLQPGDAKCSWCGQDLQVRRGGSPQRFWSTSDVLIEARLEEAGAPPQVHLEAGLDPIMLEIQHSTIETLIALRWLRTDQRDDLTAIVTAFRQFARRSLDIARNGGGVQ